NFKVTDLNWTGWFEINLDKRKLKTPGGNLFRVPHESLAMAVATEWNRQEEVVKRHDMHLTNLVNSCIDNPTRRTREDMIRGTLHFLETDTILYRLLEPPDLHDIQGREWDPLVKWTEKRLVPYTYIYTYDIDITPTTGFELPQISDGTHDRLERHLQAFSDWSLLGFQYGVEALKSLIIMLALVDKHISVDKAVKLARLETDYQTDRWGNVEWYHDIDILQLRARLAASALLIQWTSESVKVREKSSLDSSQGW
ncbi:hypothetical protein FSP39_023987, partial [Pinctada imbricata]